MSDRLPKGHRAILERLYKAGGFLPVADLPMGSEEGLELTLRRFIQLSNVAGRAKKVACWELRNEGMLTLFDDRGQDREGPWSKPLSPAQWAKVFDCSADTFYRMRKEGTIRYKELTPTRLQIHVDDLPQE